MSMSRSSLCSEMMFTIEADLLRIDCALNRAADKHRPLGTLLLFTFVAAAEIGSSAVLEINDSQVDSRVPAR